MSVEGEQPILPGDENGDAEGKKKPRAKKKLKVDKSAGLPKGEQEPSAYDNPDIEGPEDKADVAYKLAVSALAHNTQEHIRRNISQIEQMWTILELFFDDAGVAYDSIHVDNYTGVEMLPEIEEMLETRSIRSSIRAVFTLEMDDEDDKEDKIPQFLLIKNGKKEIVVYSRAAKRELFRLSPEDVVDSQVWEDLSLLAATITQIFVTRFDEQEQQARAEAQLSNRYARLTEKDLPPDIEDFLRGTIEN